MFNKRNRRRSEQFESRFREGASVDFPVRQYLRCREDFLSAGVHAVLLVAFLVTLVLFGGTLRRLFEVHGADLNPWFKRGALALLLFFCLSVVRRLFYKVLEMRFIRREMIELRSLFRNPRA